MADTLALLGSKPRLEILRVLSRKDMYVSELMEQVGMDGKRAKHHLDRLEDAGVLASYQQGRRRYYELVKGLQVEVSPSPNRRFVARFTDLD